MSKIVYEDRCRYPNLCSWMGERVDTVNDHRRGWTLVVSSSSKTGKERVLGVSYHTSAKDRGLMLNHCPFCGEPLNWHETHKNGWLKRV